ncbi:MAG TPA: hypothetical protein VIE12_03755 [Actinomycetota bacterium]|jgi:hypothetical protein
MSTARKLLAVAGTIAAIAAAIPTASAGTTLQPLHITKECSEFTGDTPSFCTITGSDLAAIPVGTKVMYRGPVLTDPNFMSSRVVLRAGHGNRAFGYCQTIADPYHGTCTFWRGTGTLDGFHASVDVTYVSGADFDWDGAYVFS